ncbi:hypothetical protein [Gluconobacter sp. P5E10]|uniref:hypothetical protein n=1 Tax=Gluconobacter sp. P5E10 TaxID=2762613 RepID=UPI001C05C508|nr:hypothetical protein [Gluconobacter sp. P5E10]
MPSTNGEARGQEVFEPPSISLSVQNNRNRQAAHASSRTYKPPFATLLSGQSAITMS